MARRLKKQGPPPQERKYYGPGYNSRADSRNPPPKTYDDFGDRPKPTGVPKGGKVKTVLRDPAAYDRRNKRPKRS